jgi:prevent-host-death family protein
MILVMADTLPLATVKAKLSELIERVSSQHDRVTITRNGRPAAVLVSADDLDGLEETLAIMSDPKLLASVRRGNEELARGEGVAYEQLKQDLLARGEQRPQ